VSKKSLFVAAAGSAFVASMAAAPLASAASNPISQPSLSSGYQAADNQAAKYFDCKCGSTKKKAEEVEMQATDKKMPEGKCGEGKCGTPKKAPKADGMNKGDMK